MANMDRLRDFLGRFHEQRPGATAQAMDLLFGDDGSGAYAAVVDAVAARCADHARVLDVGCGDGALVARIAERLPAATITGIDLAATEIATARALVPGATFIAGDFLSYPLPHGAFDCVTAHLVLMLTGELDKAIRKIGDALVPGGALIFVVDDSVMDNDTYGWLIKTAMKGQQLGDDVLELAEAADRRLYDPAALDEVLRTNGFSINEARSYRLRALVNASGAWQLVRDTYQVGALNAEHSETARRAIESAFGDDVRQIELPLKLVVATRAA